MEDRSPFVFLEWRIQNFSCWMKSAHGVSITCCGSSPLDSGSLRLSLYPRGKSGRSDRLKVSYGGLNNPSCEEGDLSFVGPDGSPFCTLRMHEVLDQGTADIAVEPGVYKVIPGLCSIVHGPTFKEVISRIEQCEGLHGDHLTLKFRSKEPQYHRIHVITTLEVWDTSLKITLPSKSRLKQMTLASVPYVIDSNEKQMLVIYDTSEKIIHLIPAQVIMNSNAPISVKYRLSVFDRINVLVRQLKKEKTFRELHRIPVKTSVLGSGGHCILRLKIVNDVYNSHISDFFHSTSPLKNAPKRIQEIGASKGFSTLSEIPRSLYKDREYSDFQLKCGGVTFPVHRCILCTQSPVFKAMLASNMKEATSGSVDIEDIDAPSLELFLEFLYTGTLQEVPSDRALELYYAADKYQVPSLVMECVDHLCAKVAISNVCDILCLGDRHGDEQLTSTAQEFILNNYEDVLKSEEWETFRKTDSLLAVKMHLLQNCDTDKSN